MEPDLKIWIDRAEHTWLDELYAHAANLFRHNFLPSHDHSHHMRVWNLCKSLLKEIATFNSALDQTLVEGVLIAAFFHDLGMAYSTREDHGRLSRESCEQWFRDTGLKPPERYGEILRAIELHDKKDEQIYNSFQAKNPPEILAVLSVADDLEALGTIGIYRYAEIYLMRGIPLKELGSRILNNAGNRFEKLRDACSLCPQLLGKYRREYDELCSFYEKYNAQLKNTAQADAVCSGPLGVINYIRKGELKRDNPYFIKLENELENARI